jgi:hypothetical protein
MASMANTELLFVTKKLKFGRTMGFIEGLVFDASGKFECAQLQYASSRDAACQL